MCQVYLAFLYYDSLCNKASNIFVRTLLLYMNLYSKWIMTGDR